MASGERLSWPALAWRLSENEVGHRDYLCTVVRAGLVVILKYKPVLEREHGSGVIATGKLC